MLGCAEVRETVQAEQQPVEAAVLAGPWQQCSSSCGGGGQERAVLCAAAPGFLGEAWQCSAQGLTNTPASTPCRCALAHVHHFKSHSGVPHVHPFGLMRSSSVCAAGATQSYNELLLCSSEAEQPGTCSCAAGPNQSAYMFAATFCQTVLECVETCDSRLQHECLLCSTEACNGAQWQYEPWGSCSAKCGGGTAARTAVCAAGSGAQGADCAFSMPPAGALQRTCNPNACALYSWQAGPWGPCSEPCAGEFCLCSLKFQKRMPHGLTCMMCEIIRKLMLALRKDGLSQHAEHLGVCGDAARRVISNACAQ